MAELTRHELGQWFTPEPVADLALALALRGASPEAEILDPSCGDGVFLRRAAARGKACCKLYGVDIDARAIDAARSEIPEAQLLHADFFDYGGGDLGWKDHQVDVIVGNPPYVRQERMDTPSKDRIVSILATDWPELSRSDLAALVGRGDLAAPFLLRTLRFLKPGGTAALVISSAFLDSAYGAQFWKLLGKFASLTMLVDAPKERWFQDAAVNAVIAVFRVGAPEGKADQELSLARLQLPTHRAAEALTHGSALEEVAEVRHASRTKPQTWAAALRAPDAWFRFVSQAGDALITLGEVAEIRRGVTSGANEIFYLRRGQASELGIPDSFLRPLLRAPGKAGQGSIAVNPLHSTHLALVIPPETELADHPALLRYLQSFEGAAQRRTLSGREPWWAMPVRPAQVFLSKAYAQRFVQPFAATSMVADQRIYCVHPRSGVDSELLSAVLNSSITALALESLGRASMGEGALEWTVGDARQLPILDPRKLSNDGSVQSAFRELATRGIKNVEEEVAQSDRQALDSRVLAAWPELAALGKDLQLALVDTCLARQRRAQASTL